MELVVHWSGKDVYPDHALIVQEILKGELVKRAGSVRGAALLRAGWRSAGRPATNRWCDILNNAIAAVSRFVPPVELRRFPGIKIEFEGQ